jgi:tetratricopeptide (TPR) repeat protein
MISRALFAGVAGLALVALLALCVLQLGSMAALRAAGAPESLVAHLPIPAGTADHLLACVPSRAARLLLASLAVRRGDAALAAERIAQLPPSHDRDELMARLHELRGERDAALRAYLAAGDVAVLATHVDALDRTGDYRAARALQERIVARLMDDPTRPDALADAWWKLGQLDAETGYREPPRRTPWMRRAMRDYERAIALAPLAERYLIAAGNGALDLGDRQLAAFYFRRTLDADPTSALAFVGLGETAYAGGDTARARQFLARARSLDAGLPEVERLAQKLPP